MTDPPDGTVDLRIVAQPPAKILELLLTDGSYAVKRDGDLVAIERESSAPAAAADAGAAAAPQDAPAPSAAAPAGGEVPRPRGDASGAEPRDRVVTGGDLVIEKGEVVHDVAVLGGRARIEGTVTGDVSVMGGSAEVREGAHIQGDVMVLGGAIEIANGARVDGDVEALGGSVEKGDQAVVGGHERSSDDDADPEEPTGFAGLAVQASNAAGQSAMLFLVGAVLLATLGERMERLGAEVAARPMRAFGLGVVGVIAFVALLVALCVTVIGIPIAVLAAPVFAVAAAAGACAALTTLGHALARHRTSSPYAHLAIGCALLFVARFVPWIGDLAGAFVWLVGVGVIVATRAAGLLPKRDRSRAAA